MEGGGGGVWDKEPFLLLPSPIEALLASWPPLKIFNTEWSLRILICFTRRAAYDGGSNSSGGWVETSTYAINARA